MENILLVNERGPDFWNNELIATQTSHAWLSSNGEVQISPHEYQDALSSLKDKKVLVLIHGLKNLRDEVLESYSSTSKQVAEILYQREPSLLDRIQGFIFQLTGFWQPSSSQAYDAVVGISWPSFTHELYYYHAKNNAQELAPKVAAHLCEISKIAKHVDVLAHSLGNFMLFEALKTEAADALKLHHIYSLAAAVPQHTLNQGGRYEQVAQKCKRLFILFSKHDEALHWPFYLAEGGEVALGLSGADHHKPIASNVTSVDCSKIAAHHSAYLQQPLFYQFIETTHNQPLPYFNDNTEVHLNDEGKIIVRS